jgi:hypothetical protein
LIGDPNSGPRTTAEWFHTSAFQQLQHNDQPQRFGKEGRNIVEGPGFTQWDVAAIKNFRIRESKTLQFRAEFFNIFNQTNYHLPNNDINSPNFGKIQGALDPRLIQLALKFLLWSRLHLEGCKPAAATLGVAGSVWLHANPPYSLKAVRFLDLLAPRINNDKA